MVQYAVVGIVSGLVLGATGLLMGYFLFPPMIKAKVAEVSFCEIFYYLDNTIP